MLRIEMKCHMDMPAYARHISSIYGVNETCSYLENMHNNGGLITVDFDMTLSRFQNETLSTYSSRDVSYRVIDLDNNKVIRQYEWEGETDISYNRSDDWKDYVDPDPPPPKRDYMADPVNYDELDHDGKIEFNDAALEILNNVNEASSLKPKEGDWVRCLSLNSNSLKDINREDLSFNEKVKKMIEKGKRGNIIEPCRIVFCRVRSLDKSRDDGATLVYSVTSKFRTFEVIDETTLEVKTVSQEKYNEAVEKLKSFCAVNNYHDFDDLIVELEAVEW